VLDVSNGAAIAFASVLVEDPASGRQLSGALTGENGRFLVQGLAAGTYKIRISFPGFLPAEADVWSARSTRRTTSATSAGEPWRVSGNVNWFQNRIDALETELMFPTRRPFTLAASRDNTWDVTLNNQIQLPRGIELQAGYIYYGARSVPQGIQRTRSSVDFSAKKPILNARAELLFTFTDIFNDFGVEHEIDGRGFTALYQNFLETQVATVGLRIRF
jgi:hypothetical protein